MPGQRLDDHRRLLVWRARRAKGWPWASSRDQRPDRAGAPGPRDRQAGAQPDSAAPPTAAAPRSPPRTTAGDARRRRARPPRRTPALSSGSSGIISDAPPRPQRRLKLVQRLREDRRFTVCGRLANLGAPRHSGMKASILLQGGQRRADAAAQTFGAIVEVDLAAQLVGRASSTIRRAEPAPLGRTDRRPALLGPGDVQLVACAPPTSRRRHGRRPTDRARTPGALIASSWKRQARTTAGLGEISRSSAADRQLARVGAIGRDRAVDDLTQTGRPTSSRRSARCGWRRSPISRPSNAPRTAKSTLGACSDQLAIDWMVARCSFTRWFSSLTSSWRWASERTSPVTSREVARTRITRPWFRIGETVVSHQRGSPWRSGTERAKAAASPDRSGAQGSLDAGARLGGPQCRASGGRGCGRRNRRSRTRARPRRSCIRRSLPG